MRRLVNILCLSVSLVLALACTGQVDDTALPVLMLENSEIDLADGSEAVFSVAYNGADVTAAARIRTVDGVIELEGNIFVPAEVGEYEFVAEYEGRISHPVSLSVTDTTPVAAESGFKRHIFVTEFTGAWCINCPGGYSNLNLTLSLPALKELKERIHIGAFHSDLEGTDTLAIAETQALFKMFKGLAYPSYVTDLRDSGLLTSDGIGDFRPSLERSLNEFPAHCGVAVSSAVDGNEAEVTVKLTSELTSEYRVVLLVVQDRIKGWQKTTLYPEGEPDYVHNHVVRKVVTTYVGTFTGEKITSDGRIAAGVEASRTWTVELDTRWVLENTGVYALALDENGYVNNMNLCAIDGGDSGYDLK